MATKTVTLYPASVTTSMCKYASVNSSYPLNNAIGKGSSNTTYAQWNLTTGSSAESYVFYKFDCSDIPADATIDSVTCKAKAYCNTTNTNRVATRTMQLYRSSTAAMGSSVTFSSGTEQSITCGTWTRTYLNTCYIRIYCKRGTQNTTTTYYARFYGATLTIQYTYQGIQYTVTSSLNGDGTIEPSGSSSVEQYEPFTLNIVPNNSGDEINITDNGTDVTGKLVELTSGDKYEVTTKSGATYGFQQDYDTNCKSGWWQSTNKAKASSASVSTVTFTCKKTTNVKVRCICYAESTYDYFLIGGMDGSLSTSASADSSAVFTTKNSNSSNEQTYTFTNVSAGTHSFDVKYFKDSYTDSNWDSAQFIVELDPTNGDVGGKSYTIDSVQENHTIVVTIGGARAFIKVNGSWKAVQQIYKKVNGTWVAVAPGDIDLTKKYKMN